MPARDLSLAGTLRLCVRVCVPLPQGGALRRCRNLSTECTTCSFVFGPPPGGGSRRAAWRQARQSSGLHKKNSATRSVGFGLSSPFCCFRAPLPPRGRPAILTNGASRSYGFKPEPARTAIAGLRPGWVGFRASSLRLGHSGKPNGNSAAASVRPDRYRGGLRASHQSFSATACGIKQRSLGEVAAPAGRGGRRTASLRSAGKRLASVPCGRLQAGADANLHYYLLSEVRAAEVAGTPNGL